MADKTAGIMNGLFKRLRDMLDGTHAEVVVARGDAPIVQAVSIALGTAITDVIDLGCGRLSRIGMPAAWDASDLTFQVSHDGLAWNNLYDSYGGEYTVKAAASRSMIIPLVDFLGVRYMKIRSGTSVTPVNQTAARTLNLTTLP